MKKSDTAKIGLAAIGVGIIGYGLYSMKKDTERIFNDPGSFLAGLFGGLGESIGGSGRTGTEADSGSSTKSFIKDTVEYITKPEEIVKSKNTEIYAENPDPTTKTQYGTAGPLAGFTDVVTKGPIGVIGNVISDLGAMINPMPDDLKVAQTKYASGDFGVEDVAGKDSLYRKLFIKEKEYEAPDSLFETSKEIVTMSTIRETLDVNVPSKYVDNVKSGSSKTGNLTITPVSGINPTDTIFDVKKSLDVNIPMTGASTGTKYTEKSSSSSSSKSYTDSTGRTYTPTSTVKAKW